MPAGLHRTYGAHHLHFITCSCYHRRPKLRSREGFLSVLEQTRQRYRFVVVGYVVMPEHFHLLMTEPEVGTPSTVMQVLKQRTAHALLPRKKRGDPRQQSLFEERPRPSFWQGRFYDFNVWTTKKRIEKLRYMHRNPVKRGFVNSAEDWRWSSYRFYWLDEPGLVRVNEGWGRIAFVPGGVKVSWRIVHRSHPFAKNAKGWGTHLIADSKEWATRLSDGRRCNEPPGRGASGQGIR